MGETVYAFFSLVTNPNRAVHMRCERFKSISDLFDLEFGPEHVSQLVLITLSDKLLDSRPALNKYR